MLKASFFKNDTIKLITSSATTENLAENNTLSIIDPHRLHTLFKCNNLQCIKCLYLTARERHNLLMNI